MTPLVPMLPALVLAAFAPPAPLPEVAALLQSADRAREKGDPAQMQRLTQAALDLALARKDAVGEARSLQKLGTAYGIQGKLDELLDLSRRAIEVARRVGDTPTEALALLNSGRVYSEREQSAPALESFTAALPLFRALGDRGREGETLFEIADRRAALEQYTEALAALQEAVTACRAAGNIALEGGATTNIGNQLRSLGRPEEALAAYERATPLHVRSGNKIFAAHNQRGIGEVCEQLGKRPEAMAAYARAGDLYRAAGLTPLAGGALTDAGRVGNEIGQRGKALELLTRALPLHQAPGGNPVFEAHTHLNLGRVYAALKRWPDAVASYGRARKLYAANGVAPMEALALAELGGGYLARFEYAKAREALQAALPTMQAIGARDKEATILNGLGVAYLNGGENRRAVEVWQQAASLFQTLGDRNGEAGAHTNLGHALRGLGRLDEALADYQSGLAVHRQTRNRRYEANTVSGIGVVLWMQNQPIQAREWLRQALALYQALGDHDGEARTLANLANIYAETGPLTEAQALYQRARQAFHAVGDSVSEAESLANLGAVHTRMGQLRPALARYTQALPLLRAARRHDAEVLDSLGDTYVTLGQPRTALGYFRQALPSARRTGNRLTEAKIYSGFGRAYGALGQWPTAQSCVQQALALYRASQSRADEAQALGELARVEIARKRPADARAHLEQAVALLERLRGDLVGSAEARRTFLAARMDLYYRTLDLLLRQGDAGAAFALAQKTKSRSLLDLLGAERVDLSGALTPDERAQETALRARADGLNAAMVQQGVENAVGAKRRYAALKAELKATEAQLQAFTDALHARHTGLAQRRVARTARLDEIARSLPADTALLEYVVASRTDVRLFVVTQEAGKARLNVHRVSSGYASLARDAAALHAACADPRKPYAAQARRLYAALLAPATAQLAGKTRLVVCPDGALWDVPFQALVGADGRFVAQRREIAYAYSATGALATWTRAAGRAAPTGSLLVAANPDFGGAARFGDRADLPGQRPIDRPSRPIDRPSRPIDSPSRPIDSPSRAIDAVSRAGAIVSLPGTQREADALRKLFPNATVLTGAAAQEKTVTARAGEFRYLHLATHGFVNDGAPLLSSIVLARPEKGGGEDGFLTARELYGLRLSAEMTVLSACNSARGTVRTGDGIVGLTWALFVAGCPTQVVSQWAVDDASTAQLMTGFYGNLATKKLGKGAALRQASLALQTNPKYRHPYYWAPFVLVGDWK